MATLVLPNVIVTTTGSPQDRTVAIGRNKPRNRTLTNFRNVNQVVRNNLKEPEVELLTPSVTDYTDRTKTSTPNDTLFEVFKSPSPLHQILDDCSSKLGSEVKQGHLSKRPVKSAFVRRPKSSVVTKKNSGNVVLLDFNRVKSNTEDDRISLQLQLERKLTYRDILRQLFAIWEPQLSESYRPFVQYVPMMDDDDRLSCISAGSGKSRNSHTHTNTTARTRFRVAETAVEAVHKFESHKYDRRKSVIPK